MNGQQLQGRDAERHQMFDDRRTGDADVSTSQLQWYCRMTHRQPTHMGLVDQGVFPGCAGRFVVVPMELGGVDNRPGDERGAVTAIRFIPTASPVGDQGGIGMKTTSDLASVGIEKQLGRIGEHSGCRLPATVNPIPVLAARAGLIG
jgi:hypothetical protein